MKKRIGTVDAPEKPKDIPLSSQWLLGQGAGAWFFIAKTDDAQLFNVKRYTPQGSLDCDRVFQLEEVGLIFDIDQPYEFTHISHCAKCSVLQNGIVFIFNYKGE